MVVGCLAGREGEEVKEIEPGWSVINRLIYILSNEIDQRARKEGSLLLLLKSATEGMEGRRGKEKNKDYILSQL